MGGNGVSKIFNNRPAGSKFIGEIAESRYVIMEIFDS